MAITPRDLDRLVSETEITPVTKRALREVRQAVMTGYASDPERGRADWKISISTRGGTAVRFHFSYKRTKIQ